MSAERDMQRRQSCLISKPSGYRNSDFSGTCVLFQVYSSIILEELGNFSNLVGSRSEQEINDIAFMWL